MFFYQLISYSQLFFRTPGTSDIKIILQYLGYYNVYIIKNQLCRAQFWSQLTACKNVFLLRYFGTRSSSAIYLLLGHNSDGSCWYEM